MHDQTTTRNDVCVVKKMMFCPFDEEIQKQRRKWTLDVFRNRKKQGVWLNLM